MLLFIFCSYQIIINPPAFTFILVSSEFQFYSRRYQYNSSRSELILQMYNLLKKKINFIIQNFESSQNHTTGQHNYKLPLPWDFCNCTL